MRDLLLCERFIPTHMLEEGGELECGGINPLFYAQYLLKFPHPNALLLLSLAPRQRYAAQRNKSTSAEAAAH